MGKQWKQLLTLFIYLLSEKPLHMMAAAMKLKKKKKQKQTTLAPWKKIYHQPRQHIKKLRHHFVNKGPSSQSYGFSSGHVWM